jgi:hypothetical protein
MSQINPVNDLPSLPCKIYSSISPNVHLSLSSESLPSSSPVETFLCVSFISGPCQAITFLATSVSRNIQTTQLKYVHTYRFHISDCLYVLCLHSLASRAFWYFAYQGPFHHAMFFIFLLGPDVLLTIFRYIFSVCFLSFRLSTNIY